MGKEWKKGLIDKVYQTLVEEIIFLDCILFYVSFSDLEILEACGKLDTNCFEIRQASIFNKFLYLLI
jgi:hypothetical protein